MTAAIGRSLVLLSLFAAVLGAIVAFGGATYRNVAAQRWAKVLLATYSAAIAAANVVMVWALLRPDFSVSYVAAVGSRSVPKWVAVVSLWSSLEGSILFWGFVLGAYLAAVAWTDRLSQADYIPCATGVWLSTAAFFSLLLSGPAQPFATVPFPPEDGPGPNALLQNHVLMALHPPFLYAGYVGMTIPFGLAVAALLTGRFGPGLQRILRTWLLVPWAFLSVAIVLGGWWAYEVLGWGGYWAWDPVENASLLPWLTATAAIHALLLVERRAALKGWTIALVMTSFLLTILGTFMTRSGVFNSVHSFTQSPIGPTILAFLALATAFVILLLAARIDRLTPEGQLERGLSRDTFLLLGNLVLLLLAFTVLVGTVFPLLIDALRHQQMSVGRPYFDRMAAPLGVALLLLTGLGPALPWASASRQGLPRRLAWPLVGAALATAAAWLAGWRNVWAIATLCFAGYALHVALREASLPIAYHLRTRADSLWRVAVDVARVHRRRVAAHVVHLGVVTIVTGIAISSTTAVSKEITLAKSESFELAGYTITFVGTDVLTEPHRQAVAARFLVARGGQQLTTLAPRMNYYASQQTPVGTPAVRSTFLEDLYLSLLSVDPARDTVALRSLVNPLVSWIWAGMMIMTVGAVAALWPTRPARRSGDPTGGASGRSAPDADAL
jgi:cytochrome c-type biogenesis protein CcmF